MKKVLILGAGFGGIRAALDLEKNKDIEVTIIDRNSFHLFTPSLYEAATAFNIKKDDHGYYLKGSVSIPLKDIFNGKRIKFVQAEVLDIDLNNNKVITAGNSLVYFDYLILALGAQTDFFGIPGAQDYAYNLKNIDDAISINNKIDTLFEEFKEKKREHVAHFVVVGGGFTGVEVAAELACCLKNKAKECRLKKNCTSITLIEAGPKILGQLSGGHRRVIRKRLEKLGVSIIEGTPVSEIGPDHIVTESGNRMGADLVVWSGGITGSSLIKKISESGNIALNKKGMIVCDKYLKVDGKENIFSVGDSAQIMDEKKEKPVPAMAYTAVDQGKVAAANVINSIKGKKLVPYKPFYSVWIAPVGAKYAVAYLGDGITFKGFVGWLIRGIVDLRYFLTILPFFEAVRMFNKQVSIFTRND